MDRRWRGDARRARAPRAPPRAPPARRSAPRTPPASARRPSARASSCRCRAARTAPSSAGGPARSPCAAPSRSPSRCALADELVERRRAHARRQRAIVGGRRRRCSGRCSFAPSDSTACPAVEYRASTGSVHPRQLRTHRSRALGRSALAFTAALDGARNGRAYLGSGAGCRRVRVELLYPVLPCDDRIPLRRRSPSMSVGAAELFPGGRGGTPERL